MNKKELYLWAKKGYMIFHYLPASKDAAEKVIGEGAKKFGFKNDGGEAFKEMFPKNDVFNSFRDLKIVLPAVSSVEIIGNTIVSKWESMDKEQITKNRMETTVYLQWFMQMFNRILTLTDEYKEFIYCDVVFEGTGKKYTYIADDSSISEGDSVIVPIGKEYAEELVTIKAVRCYLAAETPIAPIKLKHIIRKVEEKAS